MSTRHVTVPGSSLLHWLDKSNLQAHLLREVSVMNKIRAKVGHIVTLRSRLLRSLNILAITLVPLGGNACPRVENVLRLSSQEEVEIEHVGNLLGVDETVRLRMLWKSSVRA